MRGVFSIIGAVNLYMFVFILGRSEFGDGRAILSASFFVVAVLWFIEFAMFMDHVYKQKRASKADKYKERLSGNKTPSLKDGPPEPELKDRHIFLFIANIITIAVTVIALRFPVA